MPTDSAKHEGIPAAEWVRATTIGWFLGFLFMLAIILVADLIGLYGQTMIAGGIGAGVGLWQSMLLGDLEAMPGAVAVSLGLIGMFLGRTIVGAVTARPLARITATSRGADRGGLGDE